MHKARKLLEMAMEFGDTPDAVHPSHKQALATGQHGMGNVPALSPEAAEHHASETWQNIVRTLRQWGGVVPRSPRDVQGAMVDMLHKLQDVQRREARLRPQLEQLAVQTVLKMPEFKSLAGAIENGKVKIEARLKPRIQIQNIAFADDEQEPIEGEDVPEIRDEYQSMIARRKLSNTLIQGAAVANNYAFTKSFDDLADLDPSLVRDYGQLMAYSELGYFVHDQNVLKIAARSPGSEFQGGQTHLERDENGSIIIRSEAITFPMLVQEIVKGCMEFLTLNDEDDLATATAVRKRADFIDDEQVQMQIGPSIYRSFLKAIGEENADLMPYVYDRINHLSDTEYHQVMKGLIDREARTLNWLKEQVQDIREKLNPPEEPWSEEEPAE